MSAMTDIFVAMKVRSPLRMVAYGVVDKTMMSIPPDNQMMDLHLIDGAEK